MKVAGKFLFVLAGLFFSAFLYAAPVEIVQGSLKLVLYPETGGFSLYQLSAVGKNRYEPLFDDRNSSLTSNFSVLSNGRVFRLAKKPGKPVVFEQTGMDARYIYTLTDDFQVIQSFSFETNTTGQTLALRINTSIENTSGKPSTVAFKAVVDTTLGENGGIHFSTDVQNRISSETCIDPFINPDSYIVSKNNDLSLMLLVSGSRATSPESVYIANWDRLNTLSWKPDYVVGRSFNTVYSVNDSAILYVWPEKTLEANESLQVSMVLGPESDGLIALAGKGASEKNATAGKVLTEEERNSLVEQILARIAEIQSNPGSASDEELDQLNVALDLLLQKARNDNP